MFTTSTTTQHTFKTKHTSWELSESISKYLKHTFKGDASVACSDGNAITITCVNTTVPKGILDYIDTEIPTWAKQIKSKQNTQAAKDLETVGQFLNKFASPTLPKDTYKYFTVCERLLDVINDRFADLESDFDEGEGNVCYMGDVQCYVVMFNYIKKGKLKDARRIYHSLDTTEREMVYDIMTLADEIEG